LSSTPVTDENDTFVTAMEILEISRANPSPDCFWGFGLDQPKPEDKIECGALSLGGWVLGRGTPVAELMVTCEHVLQRTMQVFSPRPDIARLYPQAPGAATCGFFAAIGVLGLPREFTLHLTGRFTDRGCSPLFTIHGRHSHFATGYDPFLQPLPVTSIIGRTGSTWLMHLLATHPQIVVDRNYPYETYAAAYWMHMLRVLSAPTNRQNSSQSESFLSNLWFIGHNPLYTIAPGSDQIVDPSSVAQWFAHDYVRDLAVFCQRATDKFYLHVARKQSQREPLYFAEKTYPGHIPWIMRDIYTRPREIFLVRDFRDVVCSVFAFNAKRGFTSFGREHAKSDEDYVRQLQGVTNSLLASWRARAAGSHLVRYEDLIQQPEQTLSAVLQYLKLDASPRAVKCLLKKASSEMEALAFHRTSQAIPRSIGRWRQDLSPRLQEVCGEVFATALSEFGYQ
jgi:hypothetical protein